jgi:hypothetical protein
MHEDLDLWRNPKQICRIGGVDAVQYPVLEHAALFLCTARIFFACISR